MALALGTGALRPLWFNGSYWYLGLIPVALFALGLVQVLWRRYNRRRAEPPSPFDPAPPNFADTPPETSYQGPGDWDGGPADPPEFRSGPER